MAQNGRNNRRSKMPESSDSGKSHKSASVRGSDFVQSQRSSLSKGSDFVDSQRSSLGSGSDFVHSQRSSLVAGSDFVYDYDYLCDQCKMKEKQQPAVGFCCDCDTYICQECYTIHLRPRSSRNHKLLDESKMPRRPICDTCTIDGKDLDAVGYCQDCSEFLCHECFRTHLRPKPSRHHVLLDKTHMPRSKQSQPVKPNLPLNKDVPAAVPKTSASRHHGEKGRFPDRNTHSGTDTHHQRETKRTEANHVKDIRVTGKDQLKSSVTGGVVMPESKLVVVDSYNKKVKIIDLVHGTMMSQLNLVLYIQDITQVNDAMVVVTAPFDKTLFFVKVKDKLELSHQIVLKGQCEGIARINDKLVVTYTDPPKVEILSMAGKRLQTLVNEDQGGRLFTSPGYVEVSRDQTTIYIADCSRQSVTSLSALTGNVKAMYLDAGLANFPCGLAVDKAGNVYVVGWESNSLVQLAPDLTRPRQLLLESDGISLPKCVCYCQDTDTLYIGMLEPTDVIKGFKITH